jgi:serine/threonine protein kinase
MSPEQVRGTAVDARSDIFSFGAVIYEMLSGKRAFHRDTAADTMSAILKEDAPDLNESNRNVSPALERIVQHCLEKNPESRFHSASDIAFDLEHLSGISTTTGRTLSGAVPAAPSRRRLLTTLAVGGALALVMLGLGWWLGRSASSAPLAEYKQITFRTGNMGHARFTPDGSVVYNASWEGDDNQLYLARLDDPGARALGFKDAELLSISKNGELAIRLNTKWYSGYARTGLWPVCLSVAELRGNYWTTFRTQTGPRTERAWWWSAMSPKTATGAWNIPSATCCLTASTGSAIPKFLPTASG